jgi:hypothetical protein
VEVKPDMVGHYLAEFAITYKVRKRSTNHMQARWQHTRNNLSIVAYLFFGFFCACFLFLSQPCKHGRAGLGGAAAARFVPLK